MELIAILLSGLLGIVSPTGFAFDRGFETGIRSRFDRIEQLRVVTENPPSHQLLQGKVQRILIAGRGFWFSPEIRLDTLEIETDPLNIDFKNLLQARGKKNLQELIQQPGQAALRLVLTEEDINQALASPQVQAQLQKYLGKLGGYAGTLIERYDITNPRVQFLANNRVRFQVELAEQVTGETLAITAESGINVVAGRQLQLVAPDVTVNGKPLPPQLVTGLTSRINNNFDLRRLEDANVMARILKLNMDNQRLELATFVRVQPRQS